MYIYHLNYSPEEADLCHLEMTQLFQAEIHPHFIISKQDYPPYQSVFFKAKLSVQIVATTFSQLYQALSQLTTIKDNFKLHFVNLDDALSYEQRIAAIKKASQAIMATSNIHNPQINYGITYINQTWYFGLLEKDHQSWKNHLNKPQSYSQSLPVRLARSLVNIATQGNPNCHLLDPCCGVGTVVLEAKAFNQPISAFDIHKGMTWKANRNLTYFGYEPLVRQADISDLVGIYDAIILDIPYNLYSNITQEEQTKILQACFRLSHRLILITHENLSTQLTQIGWHIDQHCEIKKMKFIRHIFVAIY